MKITIMTSLMGVFGFNDAGKLVDSILFGKEPRSIAEKLSTIESGRVIDEILTLGRRLKGKGFTIFALEDALIAEEVQQHLEVETIVVKDPSQGEVLRKDLSKFAIETGFIQKPQDWLALTREVSLELARLKVKKAGMKRDLMIAQAILSIDDLEKTANLFMGRIREWYGLHFPELDHLLEKHETYARLVSKLGKRQNFTSENLINEGLPQKKSLRIAEAAAGSMGAELEDLDIDQIQSVCSHTLNVYTLRTELQTYADKTVGEVAPNIHALVGPLLSARLIALAGGLDNLAMKPASTIQVLGAEKALFRALKTGTRPPKHGVIYQDTVVHDAKKWQRGKMSRALAGKLAIAARTDAFSGRYIGDSLKADLQKRVDEIKEKYQKAPVKKQEPARSSHRVRRKRRGHKR